MQVNIDTHIFDFPDIALPTVWTVEDASEPPRLQDIEPAVRAAVHRFLNAPELKPGATVAVGVGSRGIANLATIVKAVVDELQRQDLRPFIVPAMGSHGGATAEGQQAILASYGVTPDKMGVPIRATMDVVQIGALDDGYPIFFDRFAHEADAVVVINRIKHHTDFKGVIESGLCKMCAIGLGKRHGADHIHRFGADGLRHIMPEVGRRLVEAGHVVGGVAIIENPYGETAEIHGLTGEEIGRQREQELLDQARTLAPRLLVDDVDVLIVDEMGKDVSGTGMDTHVIGRVRMPSIPESEWDGPNVRMVVTLSLTPRTHGNAAGLHLADIVTRRLVEQMDVVATCTNHRTSQEGGAYRGGLPIVLETPEAAVRAAIGMCGRGDRSRVRLVRIRNTEHVHRFEVSEALLEEVQSRPDLRLVAGPHTLDLSQPLAVS